MVLEWSPWIAKNGVFWIDLGVDLLSSKAIWITSKQIPFLCSFISLRKWISSGLEKSCFSPPSPPSPSFFLSVERTALEIIIKPFTLFIIHVQERLSFPLKLECLGSKSLDKRDEGGVCVCIHKLGDNRLWYWACNENKSKRMVIRRVECSL